MTRIFGRNFFPKTFATVSGFFPEDFLACGSRRRIEDFSELSIRHRVLLLGGDQKSDVRQSHYFRFQSHPKVQVSRTFWSTGHLGEFADSPGLTRLKVHVSRIFGRLCQKSMTEFDTTHRVLPRRKKKFPGEFLVVYVKWSCPIIRGIPRTSATKSPVSRTCWSTGHLGEFAY